ncbi:hypothetical protein FKM82_001193 [Ascaphus truei]
MGYVVPSLEPSFYWPAFAWSICAMSMAGRHMRGLTAHAQSGATWRHPAREPPGTSGAPECSLLSPHPLEVPAGLSSDPRQRR